MNPGDVSCALMRSVVRFGAYTGYVQHRVVQAQYFRDPRNLQGMSEAKREKAKRDAERSGF